jgi:diguanylate cyclase (GGDEF)-like protein
MSGLALLAGMLVLLVVALRRSWVRSGPASGLRRGLWLLAPAALLTAAPLALDGAPDLSSALGAGGALVVIVALLRATPARGVGPTREHATEAAIAGLAATMLVAVLLPAAGPWTVAGVLLLACQLAVLWLVWLGGREVRPQGRTLQGLVAGGMAASAVLRLAGEAGMPSGGPATEWLVAVGVVLVPALALTAALAHPQVRAPLPHVTRSAPQLALRQVLLLAGAAVTAAALGVALPLRGLSEGWTVTAVSASLTLLVVLHLVLLVDRRGRNVWEAQHDALTGLPTEPLFEDRLRQAIAGARRSGSGLTVAFVDLDGFKQVNDTCGHEVGDEVLRRAAGRLTGGLRAQDTVARRSGDEFLLLLADTENPAVAQEVVERVLHALSEPMEIDGQRHQVGASAGLASWPRDGLDADELVQHADEAMYDAKEAGRGQVCWYRTMAATRTHLRLTLAQHLQTALAGGGQLELDHQPLVDLRDGIVTGLVCRPRWRHPVLGRLSPAAFLPVAERAGLWRVLDLEVLRLACEQAATWRAAGLLDVPLTVTLSHEHTRSGELAGDVLALLDRFRLPPDALVLAVSEDGLCRGGEVFEATVDELADNGVGVVLAGFGSVDVGVRRLSHIRIARLELASSLVERVTGVEGPVVDTILRLAEGLGLEVQAEGAADDTQVEALRSHGCMVARGPELAEPISGDELTTRLRARSRRQRPLDVAELASITTAADDTSSDDSLLTAALDDTGTVLESELSDLLRRVGESVLERPTVVR